MSRISQKLANRRAEPLQKLIVFRIRREWFAVPIQFAQKVVPLGLVYGAPQGGISLTRYQDQELPVIDVEQRIFGQRGDSSVPAEQRHLMIVDDRQGSQGSLVGIPLDSPPTLRRVTKAAFSPIPTVYLAEGCIQCVSALIRGSESEPPFFLLDLDQLLQVGARDSRQIASSYSPDLSSKSPEAIAESEAPINHTLRFL
jgi:chemotaxis signal transduction protein